MNIKKSVTIDKIYPFEKRTSSKMPLVTAKISAGFPSPADDYIDKKIDLNEYLIKHPAATFFVRVVGDSMINAGIHSGDLLIVDRAIEPADNKIIIAIIDGELTVKRIHKKKNKLFLAPENPAFNPIEITSEMQFEVWGVVTCVIRSL